METIDILESRIKEALLRKADLEVERRNLIEEVLSLREAIKKLEIQREEMKSKLDEVIEKIEIYLSRSEA